MLESASVKIQTLKTAIEVGADQLFPSLRIFADETSLQRCCCGSTTSCQRDGLARRAEAVAKSRQWAGRWARTDLLKDRICKCKRT